MAVIIAQVYSPLYSMMSRECRASSVELVVSRRYVDKNNPTEEDHSVHCTMHFTVIRLRRTCYEDYPRGTYSLI